MLPNLFTNAQALEAVHTICPMLPQLLGAEAAQQVDRQIAELLNQPDLDENIKVDRLIEVLDQYPATQTWLDNCLQPNNVDPTRNGGSSLDGDPPVIPATGSNPQVGMTSDPDPDPPTTKPDVAHPQPDASKTKSGK